MFFFLVIFFHSMEFEGKGKLLKPLATNFKIPSLSYCIHQIIVGLK
jgi:hypothetical protein